MYFPVKAYSSNIIEIKKKIDLKKTNCFLIYNSNSKHEIHNEKNSFLIDFKILKLIPFRNFFFKNINIFITSYVNYVFPPNSQNIYICHDITDVPMVNKNIEKNIFHALTKYDHIFLSSNIVINYFKSKFLKYCKKIKSPDLINTGYLKLDNVVKNLKKYKNIKKDSIFIAPTSSFHMKNFNLTKDLIETINYLLLKKYKVIYRPHPLDLTEKGNKKIIKDIKKKFKKFENFTFDSSVSYLKSYASAKIMITDFSGTAYTFAYSTLKPVLFLSTNEKNLSLSSYNSLYYFKDRAKVGSICKNFDNFELDLLNLIKNRLSYKKKIYHLRKKRILHIGKALDISSNSINKILYKKNEN